MMYILNLGINLYSPLNCIQCSDLNSDFNIIFFSRWDILEWETIKDLALKL